MGNQHILIKQLKIVTAELVSLMSHYNIIEVIFVLVESPLVVVILVAVVVADVVVVAKTGVSSAVLK